MEPILKQRILQLTPIISDAEERIIMPHLTECISSRWCPDFIDITAQNVDKGYGLLSIVSHQGIKIEETMALVMEGMTFLSSNRLALASLWVMPMLL